MRGSEISLKRVILRSLFSSSDRARQDFESLVLLAAKAALSLPRLEVLELWGSCLDGEGSLAYIFRYVYEGGRAIIVWRSCEETRDPSARVIAKWSEVAQKHCHSTLMHNAIPLGRQRPRFPGLRVPSYIDICFSRIWFLIQSLR